MTKPSIAVFVLPTPSRRALEHSLSRLAGTLSTLADVFYVDAGRGSPASLPSFVKSFRHPAGLRVGDTLRLGLLRATESKHTHLLLLHPEFPLDDAALKEFLARATAPVAGPAQYALPVSLEGRRASLVRHFLSRLTGLELPLWHAPLRLLRLDLLRTVPFLYNGANQSFDLDLAIQLACSGQQIETIALAPCEPLRRWPGKLALTSLLRSAAQFRLMQYELFYDPKFDVAPSRYLTKEARTSIHHFLRNIPLAPGSEVLDVGGGNGEATGLAHARRGVRVTSIDQVAPPVNSPVQFHRVDLDQPWLAQFPYRSYDTIFALDVLEHLKTPETGLREIFRLLRRQGTLYASTANVAFFPLRLMLLSGQFNYGRRGILDLTHRRLFTIGSFKRILRNSGFSVEKVYGFGPPILDLSRNPGVLTRLADSLFAFLARVWPAMFAFQFVAVCKRMDSPSELLPEIRVES